jgi:putative peptidoglycan lipid II flippase
VSDAEGRRPPEGDGPTGEVPVVASVPFGAEPIGVEPGAVGFDEAGGASGGSLRRAVGSMAMGTAVSRGTGVVRVLVLAYVLGISPLADAYNLANTIPNMLYDVVLGGVLGATFIPVFIERLATRSEREAWRSISAVVTLATIVLIAATAVFLAAAPWVVDAFTAFNHSGVHDPTKLALQRQVSTAFLRWFTPQILLYGLLAIGGALLNVRRRFGAPMWVPIANNVVCIGVLVVFASVAPSPTLRSVAASPGQIALLGAGTTAGVAVQLLLLGPSLWRAKLGRLRWRFDLRDSAVRAVVRLGSWTFGIVVLNQVALYVVIALAFSSGGSGPVSAYTYAYAFMQMPYAIVAVSVLSGITPDLAHHHAVGEDAAFVRRFGTGLRATLALIVPSSIVLFMLATPLIALLLGHGASSARQSAQTASALAKLALGLPGFTVFQYAIRALQARREAATAFALYVGQNILNVVLAILLVRPLGLGGVVLSVSIAYSAMAVASLVLLRSRMGRLGPPRCYRPLARIVVASVVMGAVVLVVANLSGATSLVGLVLRVGGALLLGGLAYLATAALLARRSGRRPNARVAPSRRRP